MTIPDDWTPTAGNINALPKPLREYIMRLSTDEKRAGLIAKVQILEGQLAAMNRMLEEAPEGWVGTINHGEFSQTVVHLSALQQIEWPDGKRVKLVVVDE